MKKTLLSFIAIIVIIFVGLWSSKSIFQKKETAEKNWISPTEAQAYWTCPMHPQIHSEHPGECPICHMKLVPVKAQQQPAPDQEEARAPIRPSADQLSLTSAQKEEVEKMNLKVKIPVAGRFISSSAIAFQIYESDLGYVKPGLSFSGVSSFYPDDEVKGTISSVDSIVDPTSRTVRVIGSVQKGLRSTPSETGFRGDIEFELKNRVAIPESSVLHTGAGDLVYVFTKVGELAPRKVSLGLKSEGFYDVLSGVQPGELISSGPNFLMDSESRIRGISEGSSDEKNPAGKVSTPSCPKGQHWDIPMSMCMPGES